ncbi:GvpL/GvpF family gas vesicle protein [Streptomyces sp. NPDC001312]|uniref:GvpL/GvpF family gas vesicle protein n=1 Tax=Streptomyces sp. NPDC001312 TaxID=3364561 RepID=UPI0036A10579
MSTYVYGVIHSSDPPFSEHPAVIGEPPRPLRILREGDLAAIVSRSRGLGHARFVSWLCRW